MTKDIKELLQSIIPQEHLWKFKLLNHWDTIMGHLKDKVTIEQITNDTLFLGVIHPAWAQELFLLSSQLKQKINNCLAQERIKTIRFVSSDKMVKKTKKQAPCSASTKTYNSSPITALSMQEQQKLSFVKDHDLKLYLEQFFIRCKNVKECKR